MYMIVIIFILFVIICLLLLYLKLREDLNINDINIIGYIHVCQKGEWYKSYDLLIDAIRTSKLYDNTSEIRVGIVNEYSQIIKDERFNDPKIKIIFVGDSKLYERPTLLHMKEYSCKDKPGTLYYYLHTKGIRWFGTEYEKEVLDWINSMLYWNIIKWQYAVEKLYKHSTYGCNFNGGHYVGNFWWATQNHIKKLPDKIADYYTAPEDWILTNKDGMYCSYNCGTIFKLPYPKDLY